MGELTVNQEGCALFEPNPFKKEKCKHCTRPWTEHLGVITAAQVEVYRQQLKKTAEVKAKAEEETRAKAKVKKHVHTPEDDWFNDGVLPKQEDSDDDETEFKMYTPGTMSSAPIDHGRAVDLTNKPLKVVNLVDFGECDLPSENTSPVRRSPPPPADSVLAPLLPSSQQDLGVMDIREPPPSSSSFHPAAGTGFTFPRDEATEHEMELLRQMLADANEEKHIQVAIVRDEVASKQKRIDDFEAQNATLRLRVAEVEHKVSQKTAEAEECISTLRQVRKDLDDERDASKSQQEESEELRKELEELRTKLDNSQRLQEERHRTNLQSLETEKQSVDRLQADLDSSRATLEQLRTENDRLRAAGQPALIRPNHTSDMAVIKKLRRIRRDFETHLDWCMRRDAPEFKVEHEQRMEPKGTVR